MKFDFRCFSVCRVHFDTICSTKIVYHLKDTWPKLEMAIKSQQPKTFSAARGSFRNVIIHFVPTFLPGSQYFAEGNIYKAVSAICYRRKGRKQSTLLLLLYYTSEYDFSRNVRISFPALWTPSGKFCTQSVQSNWWSQKPYVLEARMCFFTHLRTYVIFIMP